MLNYTFCEFLIIWENFHLGYLLPLLPCKIPNPLPNYRRIVPAKKVWGTTTTPRGNKKSLVRLSPDSLTSADQIPSTDQHIQILNHFHIHGIYAFTLKVTPQMCIYFKCNTPQWQKPTCPVNRQIKCQFRAL